MGFNAPQYYNEPEPEDPGFDMDYGVLGNVLSGAGNLINLPGSMVRDAISFSNPIDQLFTPFSDENRTSGAEISRYWMGGDENSGGNQMAGLLIDVLTDPLMLATGGTAAAGKLGAKAGMSALKGAGNVLGATKSGYRAGMNATTAGKLMQQNKNLARRADAIDMMAANTPAPGLGRPANLTNQTQQLQQQANNLRRQMSTDDQIKSAVDLANKNLDTRFDNATMPIREGVYRGAGQLGRSMYGGARTGLGNARSIAGDFGGRVLGGDRNAMLQSAAIAGNTANAMGGLNMRDEPSLEDMIAQALMEDPDLSQQLLMMLSGE
jgi:hypothetical protein